MAAQHCVTIDVIRVIWRSRDVISRDKNLIEICGRRYNRSQVVKRRENSGMAVVEIRVNSVLDDTYGVAGLLVQIDSDLVKDIVRNVVRWVAGNDLCTKQTKSNG